MAKLTDSRKQFIRENFDTINPDDLSPDELSYYNKVKAGKMRSKKAIRFEGRFLSGEIVNIIGQVADNKGVKLQKYLDTNREAIHDLIDLGFTQVSKNVDKTIDLVNDLNKKYIEVDDGEGNIKRMTKAQAIESLSIFQQHVKSSVNAVNLATNVKTYKNGKVRIVIPRQVVDITGEELIAYLDSIPDIFYIIS